MRALAVAALIAGALLRILILPIGVPAVDDSWRAWSSRGDGVRAALTAPAEIVTHAYAMAHGLPHPRLIGSISWPAPWSGR